MPRRSAAAHGALRRVRIDLDAPGRTPGLDLEQPLGRRGRAGEIGNPAVWRERKARQLLHLEAIPHRLTRLVLVGELLFHDGTAARGAPLEA
jgi:hypothetical protein